MACRWRGRFAKSILPSQSLFFLLTANCSMRAWASRIFGSERAKRTRSICSSGWSSCLNRRLLSPDRLLREVLAMHIGKGGVGKTTVSAAYAIRAATRRHAGRVLLISTDPAHSLADVLQIKLRDRPAAVARGAGKLTVWQMNPAALFRDFLRKNKRDMLKLVERGSLFTADEISPLLDTALPGMSEISGLLAIHDAVESGKYSSIVVDTAPFGHTLRLFELPQQFERLLNFLELSAGRDQVLAAHFGGSVPRSGLRFV